jgi:hypothetical protein
MSALSDGRLFYAGHRRISRAQASFGGTGRRHLSVHSLGSKTPQAVRALPAGGGVPPQLVLFERRKQYERQREASRI